MCSFRLGAALIGGGASLVGGRFGAKWVAEEQRKFADEIAADRRRETLQTEALLQVDESLTQLESRAQAAERQWAGEHASKSWWEGLTRLLRQFAIDYEAVRPRIRDDQVRRALDSFRPWSWPMRLMPPTAERQWTAT